MRRIGKRIWSAIMGGDKILLLLCLVTSCLGCIAIASCTAAEKFGDGSIKYVIIQLLAIGLGQHPGG